MYGVFLDPAFDSNSATVPVIIYVISYNIRPRYNGSRVYLFEGTMHKNI